MTTPPAARWTGLTGSAEADGAFTVLGTQPPPKQLVVRFMHSGRKGALSIEQAAACGLRPRSLLEAHRVANAATADDCLMEMSASLTGLGIPQPRRGGQWWSAGIATVQRAFVNSSATRAILEQSSSESGDSEQDDSEQDDAPRARSPRSKPSLNEPVGSTALEAAASALAVAEQQGGRARGFNLREFGNLFSQGGRELLATQTRTLRRLLDGAAQVGMFSPGGLRLSGLIESCLRHAGNTEGLLLSSFRSIAHSPGAAKQREQRVLLTILRRCTDLASALLRIVVPRILPRLRRALQAGLVAFHNSSGMRLSTEGPLSHYRIKLLRTTELGDQSFEKFSYSKHDGIYHAVRKANPCAPTARLNPRVGASPVLPSSRSRAAAPPTMAAANFLPFPPPPRPLRTSSTLYAPRAEGAAHTIQDRWRRRPAEARVTKQPSGGSDGGTLAAAIQRTPSGRKTGSEGADLYLEQHLPRCVVERAKTNLPNFIKAQLPCKFEEGWMPAHMRDEPDKARAAPPTTSIRCCCIAPAQCALVHSMRAQVLSLEVDFVLE
eukprot:860290-Prymnesium_polylepis.1